MCLTSARLHQSKTCFHLPFLSVRGVIFCFQQYRQHIRIAEYMIIVYLCWLSQFHRHTANVREWNQQNRIYHYPVRFHSFRTQVYILRKYSGTSMVELEIINERRDTNGGKKTKSKREIKKENYFIKKIDEINKFFVMTLNFVFWTSSIDAWFLDSATNINGIGCNNESNWISSDVSE